MMRNSAPVRPATCQGTKLECVELGRRRRRPASGANPWRTRRVQPLGGVPTKMIALGRRVHEGPHLLARPRGPQSPARRACRRRDGRSSTTSRRTRSCVEHRPGLLRGRRRVQVRERLPVDHLLEDGEIPTQLRSVNTGSCTRRPWNHCTEVKVSDTASDVSSRQSPGSSRHR
jgi:hypothetical protein